MTLASASPPAHTWRLIPSRFPPIGAFDTVSTTADLEAVMELEGWTNDRLVVERLGRLPKSEWVFGIPNASVVMAAFLHAAPSGGRFNGPELGAWYAGAALNTAIAEVAHHLRREAVSRSLTETRRVFRCYSSKLLGDDYVDLRDMQAERPELYAPLDYAASQSFGESTRASNKSGIMYDSLRHAGGMNVVGFRPLQITEVMQAQHYDILAPVRGKIVVMAVSS